VQLPHVFTLRDIPDMDRIEKFMEEQKPKRAVVIGGGFIGMEMAEAFHHRGMHVTVVELSPHILPLLDHDMATKLADLSTTPGQTVAPSQRRIEPCSSSKPFSFSHRFARSGIPGRPGLFRTRNIRLSTSSIFPLSA
jgi:NAD(P)H-nitrite reductase large subunit